MILTRGQVASVDVSNVLSEEKKQQIIALGRLGWSLRKIQKATGVRRETAADYLRAAGIGLRSPGAWGRSAPPKPANGMTPDLQAAKPANRTDEVTPDSGAESAAYTVSAPESQSGRRPSVSECEPHREAIELGLSKGRNAKGIWQDLVDIHGFTGDYQSVKRFVRRFRGQQSPDACSVIETAPGEESQVDYGSGPMVRDAHSGKYRRTRLFVLTLGYSRKSVRLLVFHSSSQIWAELHEKAFHRLGGVTRVVVLDNLREGVLKPDIYDPTVNPLYRDVLSHYGSGGAGVPGARSGSQGEGRVRRRSCQENAPEGTALRKSGGGSDLPGPLGGALGGHTHSRHHQTASGSHVRRRKSPPCYRCRSSLSATTNMASAR
jgi:hypothetical protein